MSFASPQVSADLIWEITRNQNAFLVKRSSHGGVQFSKDPYNLVNLNSRKHAGYINEKAVGIVPGEKGGVTLLTKKANNTQRPATLENKVTLGANKSNRKTYKAVANAVAKSGYRGDLRASAVSRASAIRKSQRPVKDSPAQTLRGAKAAKAAAGLEI